MTEAAIIAGALVDVRNVGTHKSVKLTIHVPEEHATRVVAAFGWPTGVNPVSVAIARLNPTKEVMPDNPQHNPPETQPRPVTDRQASPVGENKPKREWGEMSPAQQAGILCNETAFHLFLREKHRNLWLGSIKRLENNGRPNEPADVAAATIRSLCNVMSRREITRDNADWSALVLAYRLWQREPEFVA